MNAVKFKSIHIYFIVNMSGRLRHNDHEVNANRSPFHRSEGKMRGYRCYFFTGIEQQKTLTYLLNDMVKPSALVPNPPFLSSYANQALSEQRSDWLVSGHHCCCSSGLVK